MGFLDPIANFMGMLLALLYQVIPNFGVTIIILTVLVNLVMTPLNIKQMRSMRGMQEIQPEIKRLQKEYKADREELNKQLMALYKERGVNPAAGCLPMLVQLPIWFALFRLLRDPAQFVPEDSELATALADGETTFLGMDLLISPSDAFSTGGFVEAIPYILAILLVIATGYYQQRQTMARRKTNGDQSQQQQTMQTVMKIFPLFFGFISWGLASGLVVYFASSNSVRIGQQAFILRVDERHEAAKAEETGEVRAKKKKSSDAAGTDGGTPAEGDDTETSLAPETESKAQQGSKKKKKKRRRN